MIVEPPMGNRFVYLFVLGGAFFASPAPLWAEVLFESATSSPPVTNTIGHPVLNSQMLGYRFQVLQAALATEFGAHLLSDQFPARQTEGSIVRLTGANDYPDSFDRSTSDYLRTAVFEPTNPSSELTASITPVFLDVGWYALVFGQFSTGGGTYMVDGGDPIGVPNQFVSEPRGFFSEWTVDPSGRVFVTGIVPEPAPLASLLGAGLITTCRRRPRRS